MNKIIHYPHSKFFSTSTRYLGFSKCISAGTKIRNECEFIHFLDQRLFEISKIITKEDFSRSCILRMDDMIQFVSIGISQKSPYEHDYFPLQNENTVQLCMKRNAYKLSEQLSCFVLLEEREKYMNSDFLSLEDRERIIDENSRFVLTDVVSGPFETLPPLEPRKLHQDDTFELSRSLDFWHEHCYVAGC